MKRHGPIGALLALGIATGAASAAPQAEDIETYWRSRLLAPQAAREQPIPMPQAQRRQILGEIGAWAKTHSTPAAGHHAVDWLNFTYAEISASLDLADQVDTGPHPFRAPELIEERRRPALPEWFITALATQVQGLSLARASRAAPRLPATWEGDPGAGGGFAWAGPAVKDGVARYRAGPNGTTVRLAMPVRADLIYRWARLHGLPLQLRLVRDAQPVYAHSPVIIEGSTDIPVWLVGPDGLVSASLTAFSTGGETCDGSQWIEFSYQGSAQPPVWAVLGFSDPAYADGVSVQRLPRQARLDDGSLVDSQRSELTVRWLNERMPGLRIAARRLEWRQDSAEPDQKSEVLGSAWGTQVFRQKESEQIMLSSAGTPACPLP